MRPSFFLILFLSAMGLYAQWDIVDEVFVPPTFYVGDSVLLQFRLVWTGEKELTPPAELPRSEWLEIESVTVDQKSYEAYVAIRFKSYMVGTRSLPPLELGDITLDSLKIFTSSLVEQEKVGELRGLRKNSDFPGIGLLIPVFLLLIICSPYLLFILLRMIFGRLRSLIRWLLRSGPRRRISRLYRKLQTRVEDSGEERDFFIAYSQGIRTYLSERTGRDFLSLTTRDMMGISPPPVRRKLWDELTDLLKMADLVKFAGERTGRKDKLRSLEVLSEFIENLEKEDFDADL
ncbi:MAG: hypothetical protein JXA95_13230 [Spirochaetales bacterium]|nr:hypothetical protein [Spirochaetales bacterium]